MLKKEKIKELAVFFFFGLFVIFINLNNEKFNYDRIWVFHMLKKISEGDLIYRDMNIITGPIFYLIGGLCFKIFGANFFTFDILQGVTYGIFALLFYKISKEISNKQNKYLDILTLVFLYINASTISMGDYNLLCLIFIMLAMYMEIKRQKSYSKNKYDFLIGMFIALAFLSKQTIGGMAVIATGIISIVYVIFIQKQNPIKEILIKAGAFLLVYSIAILLMIHFENFYDYIDLCFGSILEFGGKNISFANPNLYTVIMLGTLFTGCMIFKLNKNDKELFVIDIYALATLFYMVPISNSYHVFMSLIMSYFVLLKIINILVKYEKNDLLKLISAILIVSMFTALCASGKTSSSNSEIAEVRLIDLVYTFFNIVLLCTIGIKIIKEKLKTLEKSFYILVSILIIMLACNYFYTIKTETLIEGLEIYSMHGFEYSEVNRINNIVKYIKEKEKEGYNVMVVSCDASLYFVPLDRNNNKFDLFLYGNLGYNGTSKMISKMYEWENTIILRCEEEFWQEPKEINEYLESNCEEIGKIEDMKIYYQS